MAYVLGTKTSVSSTPAATYDPEEFYEYTTGDLLLACVTQDVGTTAISTATSGWTGIGTQAVSGSMRQAWFYKVATSGSETLPSFSGTNDDWIIQMITVRDADTTTPIHTQARGDWNVVGTVNSPAITTTVDNCLILYSWGSDNTTKMWTPPASMFVVDKSVGLGQASIIGYRNLRTAGSATTVTMTHELASEGGNAWAIAIKNATGGSLGPDVPSAVEVIRYYGGTNVNGTFAALSSVAATIGGVTASASLPTNATNTLEADSPWGNNTTFTSSTSTTPAYEGVVDTLSSTINASGKLVTFLWRPNTSVTTARYGPLGIGCIFVDTSGNWVAYQLINYVKLRPRSYMTAIEPGQGTPLASSASAFDPANLAKIGWFIERTASTTSSGMIGVKSILLQSGAVVTGGSVELPVTVDTLYRGITAGWDFYNTGGFQGSAQYLRKQPIQIGDGSTTTYANFQTASIELPKNQESLTDPVLGASFTPSDNSIDFVIKASATDTMDFASSLLVTSNPQQFRIDATSSSSATYNFLGCSIIGYAVENSATGVVFNGATFSGTRGITLNGGGLDACTVANSVSSTAVTTNNPGNIVDTTFVSAGTGHAIEITATGSFDFEGNIFTGYGSSGTTDACIYNNSGGAVTLVIPATDQTPTIRNGSGASTTISQPTDNQKVILTGGVANSRVQIYDNTSSTELVNQIVTSFPFTWEDPSAFVADREIRLRVAYYTSSTAKDFIDQVIGTATAAAPTVSYLLNQQDDEEYITNGIDGASITGVTIDDTNLLVEVDAGTITWQDLYAYEVYWLYTEAGIRDESRFFEAPDTANYRIFGFKIKNVTSPSVPLKITGGYGVDGDSGDPMDIIDTTGGTIFCSPPHVVSYAVGSGVTPADIVAIRDEIKPDLVVVNNNVQKASLFIPASEDLPA